MLTQEIVSALAALERLWLRGRGAGAAAGARGPRLVTQGPDFGPLTFHFKLTSPTSRASGYKLRLPDWAGLWKEGAWGILALCLHL